MEKKVYEFISQQTTDPIVEWKTCKVSGSEFPIYQSDMEFYDKISPVINGKKYQIPAPTLCPEERQRRRLLFRNERKLYNRICDASGKQIISIYSPNNSQKTYNQNFWFSDSRDPMEYGRDYDFSKTFTQQFGELLYEIPSPNLIVFENEDSEYTNHVRYCKKCYLLFEGWFSENIFYSNMIQHSHALVDCTHADNCEHCYQCVDIQNCYCCSYCVNCKNCKNCFWCRNLEGKEYYIDNVPYTKEEYHIKTQELLLSGKIWYKTIWTIENDGIIHSEDCYGWCITHSKSCIICFDVNRSENLKYCMSIDEDFRDSHDLSNCAKWEFMYEWTSVAGHGVFFSRMVASGDNVFYSIWCMNNVRNCFGCTGLNNKEYCILNKQYTKEEYEKLVPKIIEKMIADGEWWEFFNPSLSFFGYNETVAQEQFPLTRKEALERGYKWQEVSYDTNIPQDAKVIKGDEISIDIKKVGDDILKMIFVCEISEKPFRIIKPELEFYRKHNLPLPRKHPDIRHEERMKLRPKRELHLRNCDKCGIEIISVYPKDFEWKVYCEKCYKKEMY